MATDDDLVLATQQVPLLVHFFRKGVVPHLDCLDHLFIFLQSRLQLVELSHPAWKFLLFWAQLLKDLSQLVVCLLQLCLQSFLRGLFLLESFSQDVHLRFVLVESRLLSGSGSMDRGFGDLGRGELLPDFQWEKTENVVNFGQGCKSAQIGGRNVDLPQKAAYFCLNFEGNFL